MRFDVESTICSIATGAEGAYRGAIRITGPNSVAIVQSAFDSSRPEPDRFMNPIPVAAIDPDWQTPTAIRFTRPLELPRLGSIEVDVFVWPDSRSYTGQPSVELHCLGNIVVLESIQSRLLEPSAILAQPGEFTLRAFLAGRLDLTQCEAVLGVIHASNERSLHVALLQLAGGISAPLQELRNSLVTLLADIEAGLDFVDEDIEFISSAEVQRRLEQANQITSDLLLQMDSRSGQTFALQVAIVGAPNAGKSSLVNALVAKHVSIVSDQPGTTRDYVRTRLDLDGAMVDLLDTAGMEVVDEATPRGIAQQFTRQMLEQADLVLHCHASDDCNNQDLQSLDIEKAKDAEVWFVKTKCDLGVDSFSPDSLNVYTRQWTTSVFEPESIRLLTDAIREWAHHRQAGDAQVVPLTASRCVASLKAASHAIQLAKDALLRSVGDEVIASEIRVALDEIGMVAGTVYTDDILDALFSRFCIGK
jgi:tRNA modification GTPase